MPRIDDCVKTLLQHLLPQPCLICGEPGHPPGFCPGCRAALPRPAAQCRRCGASYAGPGCCGTCQQRPPAFDLTIAPFAYQAPLATLIQGFKYRARLAQGRCLGELLAEELAARDVSRPQCLIPVPLHPLRLLRRGYNQAVELALPVATRLQIPLLRTAAVRRRATRPQAELDLRQRRRNLRGAFALRRALEAETVAIVDDVMTSGETVHELALCLRAAGVRQVQVWALARA